MQKLRLLSKKPLVGSLFCVFTACMLPINLANAETVQADKKSQNKIVIPVTDDARIFALLDDKAPAVVNYFTAATEESVLNFYIKNYGQPTAKERQYGRLTVNFSHHKQQMRVIISQQDTMRQVDVILDNKVTK